MTHPTFIYQGESFINVLVPKLLLNCCKFEFPKIFEVVIKPEEGIDTYRQNIPPIKLWRTSLPTGAIARKLKKHLAPSAPQRTHPSVIFSILGPGIRLTLTLRPIKYVSMIVEPTNSLDNR
jgi:hypothetical protein